MNWRLILGSAIPMGGLLAFGEISGWSNPIMNILFIVAIVLPAIALAYYGAQPFISGFLTGVIVGFLTWGLVALFWDHYISNNFHILKWFGRHAQHVDPRLIIPFGAISAALALGLLTALFTLVLSAAFPRRLQKDK